MQLMLSETDKNIFDLDTERRFKQIEKSDVFSCLAPLLKDQKHTISDYKKPTIKPPLESN